MQWSGRQLKSFVDRLNIAGPEIRVRMLVTTLSVKVHHVIPTSWIAPRHILPGSTDNAVLSNKPGFYTSEPFSAFAASKANSEGRNAILI